MSSSQESVYTCVYVCVCCSHLTIVVCQPLIVSLCHKEQHRAFFQGWISYKLQHGHRLFLTCILPNLPLGFKQTSGKPHQRGVMWHGLTGGRGGCRYVCTNSKQHSSILSDHLFNPKGLCRRYIHYILPIWQTILQGSRSSPFKKKKEKNKNLKSKENCFETRVLTWFPYRKGEFGLTFVWMDKERSRKILVMILYSFPLS